MKPEIWGPPIWNFYHGLVANINEESYSKYGYEMFSFIKQMSAFLPCPECSQHATEFLSKVRQNHINTKKDLIKIIYLFHNSVNVRKNKPVFDFNNLNKYENANIAQLFNNFILYYNTKGNMRLLTESMHRRMVIQKFSGWLYTNRSIFTRTQSV
jgi:hypothetical protein